MSMKKPPVDPKQARLAEALRANLMKRKARMREETAGDEKPAAKP